MVLCTMVLFYASCSSTKRVTKNEAVVPESTWKTGECLVARCGIKLSDGKSKKISLNGTLRMKRDDVVQLSATYFLGIQVGTVEFSRDSVLVVSRVTRQYAVLSYPVLSTLLGQSITFNDIQKVFWGEARGTAGQSINWEYGSFVTLSDQRAIPEEISLNLVAKSNSFNLNLKLSRHSYDSSWASRVTVRNDYEELSPDQVLRLITLLVENS